MNKQHELQRELPEETDFIGDAVKSRSHNYDPDMALFGAIIKQAVIDYKAKIPDKPRYSSDPHKRRVLISEWNQKIIDKESAERFLFEDMDGWLASMGIDYGVADHIRRMVKDDELFNKYSLRGSE
jgi:hypothetical protein